MRGNEGLIVWITRSNVRLISGRYLLMSNPYLEGKKAMQSFQLHLVLQDSFRPLHVSTTLQDGRGARKSRITTTSLEFD